MYRTVPSALRAFGRVNGPSPLIRQFSTTPCYGVRAIYSETDNAELNSVLKEIQETIILPAYLPPKQRRIVFDPSKRGYLEQNPIDIEVEGLEHRFKSIDVHKDLKSSRKLLWNAIHAMRTKEDWDNLATVLAGYRKANIKLKHNQQAKVMRKAIQNGHIGSLLECLKQAQETGLYFRKKEEFCHMYLGVNNKIEAANGDLAEIRQATRWGEIVLDLAQRPETVQRSAKGRNVRTFLHFSLFARGMLLHARASLAQAKQEAGEPIDEDLVTIKDDLVLLTSLWAPHLADGKPISEVDEVKELSPKGTEDASINGRSYAECLAWQIRAIRLAEKLASEEVKPLLSLVDALQKHAGDIVEAGGEKGAYWSKAFESTLNGSE